MHNVARLSGFKRDSRFDIIYAAQQSRAGWQLENDATHQRARGANYVCDNMRLESGCRCPIQTSSSAATTGEINRATCNNRRRIIMSVTRFTRVTFILKRIKARGFGRVSLFTYTVARVSFRNFFFSSSESSACI